MKDSSGNIITESKQLLNFYQSKYIERLSSKDCIPEFKETYELHKSLFKRNYQAALKRKTNDWSVGEITKICSRLKNNKARDELMMNYELFKPTIAGNDVFNSLCSLFNSIKNTLIIPGFLQTATITSFYKNNNKC